VGSVLASLDMIAGARNSAVAFHLLKANDAQSRRNDQSLFAYSQSTTWRLVTADDSLYECLHILKSNDCQHSKQLSLQCVGDRT
jgi:hypothetical protein